MKKTYKVVLWRFLLFAFVGLLFEVIFGAIGSLFQGSLNLRGSTSLWMIFDYGLFGIILMPIKKGLVKLKFPLLARALVYMLVIYAVEYISGAIFTSLGLEIWSYRGLKYNLHGHIALIYAPLWYGLGIFAELIYGKVDACAKVLADKH